MKKKDIFRAALGSGHFPLTFNFVHKQDGKYIQCCYCGRYIYYRHITRDHVYPKSKGGTLKAPACVDCNIEKEDMKPIEWALYSYKHDRDIAYIPLGADFIPEFKQQESRDQLYADFVDMFQQMIDDEEEQAA